MADRERPSDRASVRLFGSFDLADARGAPVPIAGRRSRALIAYLLLAPEQSATRERLCGLLWGDRGEAQARSSLRQCLLEIKKALEPSGLDLLVANREHIRLATGALASDVADIEARLSDADFVGTSGPGAIVPTLRPSLSWYTWTIAVRLSTAKAYSPAVQSETTIVLLTEAPGVLVCVSGS